MIRIPRWTRRGPASLALALALVVVACDDPFNEFLLNVPDEPSETVLFDFSTGRLQDPSAFDAIGNASVRVDQTTQWDFMFRVEGGTPQLLPFSAIADSVSEAGLQRSAETFEEITVAPEFGYETSTPFGVEVGDIIVVKSRRDRTQFLICNQYVKLEVLEIDLDDNTILFRYLRNPNCGDRVLEPGTHGKL
jgi:hypothetical protein